MAQLRDRDVLVVQTKCHRLGTYLLGQAAFSPLLLEQRVSPSSMRSVAVCTQSDPVLDELAAEHNVEIVVQPGHLVRAEPKSPSRAMVNQYWKRVGGTLIPKYPLAAEGVKGGLHAEALIILDGPHEELPAGTRVPLEGRNAVVLASAGGGIGFGMYVTGSAYFSRILVERQHQARSVGRSLSYHGKML